MSNTFDSTLAKINRQTEETSTEAIADRLGLTYAKLDDYPLSLESLALVPLETVEARLYAIYVHTATRLRVAIVHPEDQGALDEIKQLAQAKNAELELTVVSQDSFAYLVAKYKELLAAAKSDQEKAVAAQQHQAEHDYFNRIRTLDDLQQEIAHASTTEVLDVLIAAAFNQHASDIHLEPNSEELAVRFRIDGVLKPVLHMGMGSYHQLVSRIKVLAKIKIDNNTSSQDGRFSLRDKGIDADIRVSIVPTGFGEGIVMRLLRQDGQEVSLEQLGFSPYNLALIQKAIRRPYGMILVTGPTGSGKSTTLYSILQQLNSPEKKILTLEDPIEYRIQGVQQSQIDPEHGFTFAEGLKGALRQDPDVVMVGEIRDPETATIALNASLTGHLVLSTMHTNDAVTAHARLLELGVEPFLLAGTVHMIIAQRLVRVPVPGTDPANPEYKGRVVIAEVLMPTQDFEQSVIRHGDQATLQGLAVAGGMVPMLQDGLEKVKAGLTTEQEIYRVTAA